MLEPDQVIYLQQAGLLTRLNPQKPATVFSPLLSQFLIQRRGDTVGLLELHPKTRAVLRGGIPLNIQLTAHEDRLLSFFLESSGEICAKDALMHAVWPDEALVEGIRDDRLAQLIKRLREKIEPDSSAPTYIQTIRGRGYRFEQPTD